LTEDNKTVSIFVSNRR